MTNVGLFFYPFRVETNSTEVYLTFEEHADSTPSVEGKKRRKGLFDFLKPSPFLEEIQDKTAVDKKYRYWRFRTFYAMYIGYAFYYLTRKSFTYTIPALSGSLGFDKAQIGLFGSVLSITYAISKFLSGIQGDKSNPRYFMGIGLILTGVCNLCFGMSSLFITLLIFWGLNGWFQGWGAPVCAKLLTHWYSHSERGRWWSVWNTAHNLGGALIPLLAAFCIQCYGWRYAMYVPGILGILGGLFIINRLRDTPQSLGLPSVEKYRNDYIPERREKASITAKEILVDYVLKNKYMWVLACAYFFIYVVRTGVNDWSLVYLMESKKYSILTAGACLCWFEIGGFFGSLAAGWISDKLFRGKRNPINFLFTIGVLATVFLLWKTPMASPVWDSILIFIIGFFIFGPQMMIGMAAAEMSHKKAVATATGFAGFFAYLGATFAGFPLGVMMKSWGWEGYFLALSICCVAAALLVAPLWSIKSNPKGETF